MFKKSVLCFYVFSLFQEIKSSDNQMMQKLLGNEGSVSDKVVLRFPGDAWYRDLQYDPSQGSAVDQLIKVQNARVKDGVFRDIEIVHYRSIAIFSRYIIENGLKEIITIHHPHRAELTREDANKLDQSLLISSSLVASAYRELTEQVRRDSKVFTVKHTTPEGKNFQIFFEGFFNF